MTYNSRGRSSKEIVIAVALVCFIIGCVCTLCIGNYLRAKKAMERQRQRRLAGATQGRGNGVVDSPRSHPSSTSGSSGHHRVSDERQPLFQRTAARSSEPEQDLIEFQQQDSRRPTVTLMSV